MPSKKVRKKHRTRAASHRKKVYWRRTRFALTLAAIFLAVCTIMYFRPRIALWYAMHFKKIEHKKLSNTKRETARIHRIISENADKTFGIDISHYQRKEDISWDSLSIGNGSIPIEFVVLRASMGNRSADKHFNEFWEKAKEHELLRGAYHFYRADEDPVLQANNFLAQVHLESGDLVPILDIEKIPRRKSPEKLVEDLKVWCKIIEEAYGEKPIIYTYFYYYKDYLEGHFDDHPLWLANYNDVAEPGDGRPWNFWQFTENGIVYGINSKVDLDIYNGNLWSLKRLTID